MGRASLNAERRILLPCCLLVNYQKSERFKVFLLQTSKGNKPHETELLRLLVTAVAAVKNILSCSEAQFVYIYHDIVDIRLRRWHLLKPSFKPKLAQGKTRLSLHQPSSRYPSIPLLLALLFSVVSV